MKSKFKVVLEVEVQTGAKNIPLYNAVNYAHYSVEFGSPEEREGVEVVSEPVVIAVEQIKANP